MYKGLLGARLYNGLLAGMVAQWVTGGHGGTTGYWRAWLHKGLLTGMVAQRVTGGHGCTTGYWRAWLHNGLMAGMVAQRVVNEALIMETNLVYYNCQRSTNRSVCNDSVAHFKEMYIYKCIYNIHH